MGTKASEAAHSRWSPQPEAEGKECGPASKTGPYIITGHTCHGGWEHSSRTLEATHGRAVLGRAHGCPPQHDRQEASWATRSEAQQQGRV